MIKIDKIKFKKHCQELDLDQNKDAYKDIGLFEAIIGVVYGNEKLFTKEQIEYINNNVDFIAGIFKDDFLSWRENK